MVDKFFFPRPNYVLLSNYVLTVPVIYLNDISTSFELLKIRQGFYNIRHFLQRRPKILSMEALYFVFYFEMSREF